MESKPIRYKHRVEWILPDGTTHREDGPAIEWNDGDKFWFVNGLCHRLDGPAIEYVGGKYEWWINNFFVTDKITKWSEEMNIDLYNLSDQDKQLISLYWGNYGK